MEWGMKNRLARLIQKDGKALFLPIDHGYFQGPTHMLEKPGETIKPLLKYADALMLTRGVLRNCVDPMNTKPIILRVSGGASVVGEDLANETIITSVQEIIRLNASAASMSIFVGSKYEHQTLKNLSMLVNECEDYGIPVMAVTAVGRELEKREARFLALCCRIAAELGARVVKTYYCAENFDKVVEGCPVPVVIAGGPKVDSQIEVFEFVYDGMQKGAIGVNLGRNIWQTEHPVAAICQFFNNDPIRVADCKVDRDKTKGWPATCRVQCEEGEEGEGSRPNMAVQVRRSDHAFPYNHHV